MGDLPGLLEKAVGFGRVERVFVESGLPVSLIDYPDRMIPLKSMVDLFENAGAAAGDRCFGLRVGLEMGHSAYGMMAAYASQAPTLHNALKRLQVALSLHQPDGRFSVSRVQGGWLWGYFKPISTEVVDRHHADHVLPCFISLARQYLGQSWTPRKVGVPYPDDGGRKELQDILGCDWLFSCPGVCVELRDNEIHARRRDTHPAIPMPLITSCEILASAVKSREMNLADRVERLVQLLSMENRADLDTVAAMAELRPRSLQRHLHEHGTSFREIVTRAQMRRAGRLAGETSLTLTEIAFSLGYQDPGNFTRAFKQFHGCSPSSFRNRAMRRPGQDHCKIETVM
jgi:AraC-like DNA-binding protein